MHRTEKYSENAHRSGCEWRDTGCHHISLTDVIIFLIPLLVNLYQRLLFLSHPVYTVRWFCYNFAAGSFHMKKLYSRIYLIFIRKNDKFTI